MAFTTMFDWAKANNFTVAIELPDPNNGGAGSIDAMSFIPDNIEVVTNLVGDEMIIEFYAKDINDLMTGELVVLYDRDAYSLARINEGDMLANCGLLRGYEGNNGMELYFSEMNQNDAGLNGSGKLAEIVLISLEDNASDITLGFDLRNTKGDVIESGSLSIELAFGDALPTEFAIESAYPNPFNNVIKMTYALPEAARVNMSVFDVSGRTVATLINGQVQAGRHIATWNAENATTGVYLIKMEAAGITDIHKVMLIK